MDQQPFILAAYAIGACLIAALCLATWARARRVNKQLDRHTRL
jgi:hypothetical protein